MESTARKRLLFLHTGGTLGMVRRSSPGPLEPELYDRDVLPYVRGLEDLASIDARIVASMDSSDMTPDHWEMLAAVIADTRLDYDGFVVLHGTDTMSYTAAALSFMLRGLDRPVVLTGSQRPIAELRTDARANLVHSAMCATMDIPEVGLYFGDSLFRGNRTTKVSIQAYDAFASPNYPPLLRMGVDVVHQVPTLTPTAPFQYLPGFERRVACLSMIPGLGPAPLRAMLDQGIRGVVLQTFGEGNVPQRDWPDAIRDATEGGVAVVLVSQCEEGEVWPGRYRGSTAARDAGAVFASDLTTEAAVVKTMWMLGQGMTAEQLAAGFTVPVAGECAPRS